MEALSNEAPCMQAKSGNLTARDLLIKRNCPFVYHTVDKLWHSQKELNESLGIELNDLRQEGLISLFECISTYNSDNDCKFLTFAGTAIHNAVLDYIRKCSASFENRNLGSIYNMDEALQDEIHSKREFIIDSEIKKPENICIKKMQYEDLHRAMRRLSERDKMYINYRYGFEDDTEHSLAETARHFHLSLSRCGATEELALDNLWLEMPWWY